MASPVAADETDRCRYGAALPFIEVVGRTSQGILVKFESPGCTDVESESDANVAEALRFQRSYNPQGRLFFIRGPGHSLPAFSVVANGVRYLNHAEALWLLERESSVLSADERQQLIASARNHEGLSKDMPAGIVLPLGHNATTIRVMGPEHGGLRVTSGKEVLFDESQFSHNASYQVNAVYDHPSLPFFLVFASISPRSAMFADDGPLLRVLVFAKPKAYRVVVYTNPNAQDDAATNAVVAAIKTAGFGKVQVKTAKNPHAKSQFLIAPQNREEPMGFDYYHKLAESLLIAKAKLKFTSEANQRYLAPRIASGKVFGKLWRLKMSQRQREYCRKQHNSEDKS